MTCGSCESSCHPARSRAARISARVAGCGGFTLINGFLLYAGLGCLCIVCLFYHIKKSKGRYRKTLVTQLNRIALHKPSVMYCIISQNCNRLTDCGTIQKTEWASIREETDLGHEVRGGSS